MPTTQRTRPSTTSRRRPLRDPLVLLCLAVAALMCITSCSTRRNNAATRNYQAFITRYNIYYNGDTHFRETLQDMESKYEDDYSRQLFVHPVEAKGDVSAPQPSGSFDRSIEKAQKAIQLRSIKKKPAKKSGRNNDPDYKAWMKREEYNPFLHNAWLMMARSQYYNGDFSGAASTFFYISRHFPWLPASVTEARIMQAMSYLAMGWLFEAEMILQKIKEDELTSKQLKLLYNMAMADYSLRREHYDNSIPYIREAASLASGAQKTRLTFLLGQILARQGHKEEAYAAFRKAGASSSASYRTKFNARIKESEVFTGNDITGEVKALRRMTHYDRNKEYHDQIYYAIGNLYLSRGDTASAIENYELGASKSTRGGIDKALNQLILGKLYFERGDYTHAQPNYSEAIPVLPASYPGYDTLKLRSEVLDELAIYAQNVELQDSLLHLASLPEDELMKVIDNIIEELKKKEREEAEAARREEYMAQTDAMGNQMTDNTNSFNINTDNSWYFYNTATRNAGKTEFQKRWGSRKLEDNWRRRNKAQFNAAELGLAPESDDDTENTDSVDADTSPEVEQNPEDLARSADPHYPEYYLAQIPFKEEEKVTAGEVIQEGLYNMGVILKDKLEDFDASATQFRRLLTDYPDNVYRLDTYFNMYLMLMRQDKPAEAEYWRQLILSDFADSSQGIALRDPGYIDKLRAMDSIQTQRFTEIYDAYLANDNPLVHKLYDAMSEEYPMSKNMPKFMFINALAYATDRNNEQFNAQLKELLERYPDTDVTPIASAWLKGLSQGRPLHTSGSNMRGMIWDQRLTTDTVGGLGADGPAQFELNPDTRQLLVFTFDTGEVNSNALLYEIARHNFRTFVIKDFDLEPMNFGRLGMIVVKSFDNMEELNHYRRMLAEKAGFLLPQGVRPVAISEADFKILLDEGRSFDEYFRYREEQNYIDAQAGLLVPEAIETLPEADEAAQEIQEIIRQEMAPEIPEEPALDSTPAPAPQTQPANPAPAPAATPAPTATPTPTATPAIPAGSEGDDPLFDD